MLVRGLTEQLTHTVFRQPFVIQICLNTAAC